MIRSFVAIVFLSITITMMLAPAAFVVVGLFFGRSFMESCILVCSGMFLSRLFRPVSVLVGNENLPF